MTYILEKELNEVRVVIDFMKVEEPKVTDILKQILCDYRKSFSTILYRKDPRKNEKRKTLYTEFYIRKDDVNRAERLLKKAAA